MKTNGIKKREDFVHLGNVISKTLKTYRHESDDELSRIWSLWKGMVGEMISENTRPAAFKGRQLIVNVSDSVWMQQLHFLEKEMMRKINKALGKRLVEKMTFKIGPVGNP